MFRKGISALILDENNRFLLVNLESFDKRFFAIPGGGLESEETLEDAAYREIHEELGLEKKHLQYVGKSDIPVRFKFKVITLQRDGKQYEGSERYFFGFQFTGTDDQIRLNSGEVRTYAWVPFSQLKDFLLFDGQLEQTTEKIAEIFPQIS